MKLTKSCSIRKFTPLAENNICHLFVFIDIIIYGTTFAYYCNTWVSTCRDSIATMTDQLDQKVQVGILDEMKMVLINWHPGASYS
jgi:hypothetical protein